MPLKIKLSFPMREFGHLGLFHFWFSFLFLLPWVLPRNNSFWVSFNPPGPWSSSLCRAVIHVSSCQASSIVHLTCTGNSFHTWYFEFEFSSFLDVSPRVGSQDHLVTLFFIFQGTCMLFALVAASIYMPANSVGRFPFLHILSSIYYL